MLDIENYSAIKLIHVVKKKKKSTQLIYRVGQLEIPSHIFVQTQFMINAFRNDECLVLN